MTRWLSAALLFLAAGEVRAQSLDVPLHTDRPVEIVRSSAGMLYLRVCVLGEAPQRRCPPPAPSVCIEYCGGDGSPITPRAWCSILASLPVPPGKTGQEMSLYTPHFKSPGWVCP
jgi:hypothetical protein